MGQKPIKCVLVGDRGVSKNYLASAFLGGKAPSGSSDRKPLYLIITKLRMAKCRRRVPVHLRITEDRIDCQGLRDWSYKGADIIMICFCMVSKDSWLNAVSKWVPEIQSRCPNTPFILVGTQRDKSPRTTSPSPTSPGPGQDRHGHRPLSEEDPAGSPDTEEDEGSEVYNHATRIYASLGASVFLECTAKSGTNLQEALWLILRKVVLHGGRYSCRC